MNRSRAPQSSMVLTREQISRIARNPSVSTKLGARASSSNATVACARLPAVIAQAKSYG